MQCDRRQFLTGIVGGAVGSVVLPRLGRAQTARLALSDRLSLMRSGGINILALSTPDGLVLVDSGPAASAAQLPEGRVATVFNTHWHPENTGANEVLRQRGAAIVAHANTRTWMAAPTWIPAEDRYRPARHRDAHPTRIVYTDDALNVGGERIEYGYLIQAHTSGDLYVYFRDANVLAVGDVVSPARDPELDYFTGAWLGGRVDAMDRLLAISNAATRIVPAYGPVMNRGDLQAERDVMKTIWDRVFDRVRQGESAADMLRAGVMGGLTRTWMNPEKFLDDVHQGLWAHHNKLSPDVV